VQKTCCNKGHNRKLIGFIAALKGHREDRLSIQQLSKIAFALIDETSKITSKVGGAIQMGIFEANKEPIWKQAGFDKVRPTLAYSRPIKSRSGNRLGLTR
jgi:hypothetical protein